MSARHVQVVPFDAHVQIYDPASEERFTASVRIADETGDQLYVSCPEPAISAVLNTKSALSEDPVTLEGGFEIPLEDLTSAIAELRS